MTVLAITITDPSPAFDTKKAEVAFLINALQVLEQEIGKGQGNTTSGTIKHKSAAGTPNTALGSWTYTPAASNP